MNGFVICPLVLLVIYVSYSPFVWCHEPGHVYGLTIARKCIYASNHKLDSSETYNTDNVRLRYDGESSYTILDNDEISFYVKQIFIVVRNFVGVSTNQKDTQVYLKFSQKQDAQDMCVECRDFTQYAGSNFEVETVRVMDNMMDGDMRLEEILSNGVVNIFQLSTYHYRFTIHPSGDGQKPPVAMFASTSVGLERGPQPNQLMVEYPLGDGAFYFGLIFSSKEKADELLNFATSKKIRDKVTESDTTDSIIMNMFQNL